MELETGKKLRTGAVIVAAGHKSKNSVFKPLLPVGDSTAMQVQVILEPWNLTHLPCIAMQR